MLHERGPKKAEVVSGLVRVIYSERLLRTFLRKSIGGFCDALAHAKPSPSDYHEGLTAFNRVAAFADVAAKREEWATEQEVRHVTFARGTKAIESKERVSAAGRSIQYLPVSLRADNKLIALDEVIIGANQDTEKTTEEFKVLLTKIGYVVGSTEYPQFTVSGGWLTLPHYRNTRS